MKDLAFNAVLNEVDSFSYNQCVLLLSRLSQTLQNWSTKINEENEIEKNMKKDFRDTYPKDFFNLFGSLDDSSFKEPDDLSLDLDDKEFF